MLRSRSGPDDSDLAEARSHINTMMIRKPLIQTLALVFLVLSLGEILAAVNISAAGKARPRRESTRVAPVKTDAGTKPEGTPEPRVLVSGNNPVLLDEQVSLPWQLVSGIWSKLRGTETREQYLWTCFSIRIRDDINYPTPGTAINPKPVDVSISGLGLGSTTFAILDSKGCATGNQAEDGPAQSCKVFRGAGGGWTKSFGCWQSFLTLPLEQQEKVIAVRVPVGLVQQAGNAIEGKIIVNEPLQKQLEIPLKIERPPDPFSTGFQWFIGIAVPAGLSFLLGYGASKLNTRFSSRTEQQKKFADYKDQEYDSLNSFFTKFYPTLYQEPVDTKRLAGDLRLEMRKKNILGQIPQKERKKLERALVLCQQEQIKKGLSALFKEWKESIENPTQGN